MVLLCGFLCFVNFFYFILFLVRLHGFVGSLGSEVLSWDRIQ